MIQFIPSMSWRLWFVNIPIHGLFAVIGMIFGFLIVLGNARKQKIHPKIMFAEGFYALIAAWLLSKLFFYLGPYETCSLGIRSVISNGFVFYGGLLGGIAAVYIYTKLRHYNFWKHADIWALGIPLGLFIARIGCFLVNDAPGKITNLWFAVKLPDGTTRHPAALYLSLLNLVLFVYLYSKKYSKRFLGQLFLQYLILYSAGRFLIEFLRDYSFHYLGLTFSQWVSIIVFVPSLVIYIAKSRRN